MKNKIEQKLSPLFVNLTHYLSAVWLQLQMSG